MADTLAQKVRAKFPDAYADLSDVQLETAVRAKFPGVYDDVPSTPAAAAAPEAPARTWGDTAQDVAIGAAKGVGTTVAGLGQVVRDYTPIGRISDAILPGAFDQARRELEPTNAAQQVGHTAEQVAEYFIPAGTAVKAGKAVRVAKDAALALAQSGSKAQAGVTGALTAVLPGGGAAQKAAGALERSAQATMAQALGATKEWAKDEAAKLAPELLTRGIGGSLHTMRTLARTTAAKVGQNLDDAYKAAAAAGETVSADIVRGNIQLASDALHTLTPAGKRIGIPGHEAAIAELKTLDEFIGQLGADIPVDKAAALKQGWDAIVSKAGLYGQSAMAPATDKAKAWSFREAANSFRDLLNTNPTIEALNKEAGFWIGFRNVMDATKLRKVAQGGGIVKAGASGVGMIAGAATGDTYAESATRGILGGLAGQRFVKLVQSPAFRSQVSAPLKHHLAEALASGKTSQIASVVGRITSSLPAQLRPSGVTP